MDADEDSEEEFVYPILTSQPEDATSPSSDILSANLPPGSTTTIDDVQHQGKDENVGEDSEEEFLYPAAQSGHAAQPSTARQVHPSPAQLESLYAAASSGDLQLLKRLFRSALENGEVEPFSLANDATSRTGFTPLHAAASRGYYDMTVWCKMLGYVDFCASLISQ